MSRERMSQFGRVRRTLSLCALVGAVLSSGGGAEHVGAQTIGTAPSTLGVIMTFPLYSFPVTHDAFVTVSEGGVRAPGSVTRVTIEIRDDADRLVAATLPTTLGRAKAVRLRASLPQSTAGNFAQARAVVRVVTSVGSGSVAQAVLEDVDAGDFGFTTKLMCSGNPDPGGISKSPLPELGLALYLIGGASNDCHTTLVLTSGN
jgi:hypothetical protein